MVVLSLFCSDGVDRA